MKRKVSALLLALLMILTLAACGGSSKYAGSGGTASSAPAMAEPAMAAPATPAAAVNGSYAMDAAEAAPMPAPAEGIYEGSAGSSAALADQKMIYTASLALETTEFDDAAAALSRLTEACGGYFERSSMSERGAGYRWSEYTIRIPKEQFRVFLEQAGQLAHLTWQSTGQENITEMYYDTAGRLETQKIKLERLQSLLKQAENMEDIITIESAISETEWNIENLSGTLRHYDALVDYSTVTVTLNEVYKLSDADAAPLTFGDRLGRAFAGGLHAFGNWLENVAVDLAYSWTWLLVFVVVVVAVIAVIRSGLRRRKAKKAAAAQAREEQTKQTEQKQ